PSSMPVRRLAMTTRSRQARVTRPPRPPADPEFRETVFDAPLNRTIDRLWPHRPLRSVEPPSSAIRHRSTRQPTPLMTLREPDQAAPPHHPTSGPQIPRQRPIDRSGRWGIDVEIPLIPT